MSKVGLFTGTTGSGQAFLVRSGSGDPTGTHFGALEQPLGMVPGFNGAALYEGPNYTGASIVVTNPGTIADLSHDQFGNWANRIRSIRVEMPANRGCLRGGSQGVRRRPFGDADRRPYPRRVFFRVGGLAPSGG